MDYFLQQVIDGLSQGSIYAALAIALVLGHRTTGIINFSQGAMATFSAFLAHEVISVVHWPYAAAAPVVVVASFLMGMVLQRLLIAPLRGRSYLGQVTITVALVYVFDGLSGTIWGYQPLRFPSPFPARAVQVHGVYVSLRSLGVIAVAVVALLLLFVFFRFLPLGLAVRAAARYPQECRLMGINVGLLLATGWGVAAAVGAVAGLLTAPIQFLDPNMMTPILLYAFASAVLGGLESVGGAVVGGLLIGVVLNLTGAYVPGMGSLRDVAALTVITLVLLVKPSGLFGRAKATRV